MNVNIQDTLKHFHADSGGGVPKAEDKDKSQARKLHASKSHKVMSKACTNDDQVKMELRSANPVNACYRESGQNKTLCTANSSCKQNLCEETTSEKKNFVSQSRYNLIIVSNFYLLIQHLCVCACSTMCYTLKHWDTEMTKHGFGEEPNVGSLGKGVWTGQSWPIHLGSGMSYARFSVLTHTV